VVGIDVNSTGKLLLVSLAFEEPDTVESALIDHSKSKKVTILDCENLWYQGYGNVLAFGEKPDEFIVLNDDFQQTLVVNENNALSTVEID
jgi:hypothetical protein